MATTSATMERSATLTCSGLATLAIAFACLGVPAAQAHHSVSAWFDTAATTEIEGVVTQLRWQNPHVVFTLRVDEGGGEALWEIETLSISGISRWGLTRDLFAVGDRLRVAGNPARRNASNIFVRNILLPTGREIVLGGAARWSSDTLRGSELLQAREGDSSRPELGLFRTWSTGGVNGVLFPEAVQANFDFSRYPLTPSARAALEQFDFETDDPTVDCAPKGMPTIMEQPYPMEVVDRGDTIELLIEEYDTRRVVHMRGAGVSAAATAAQSPLGYSVGRFEGATLVVTTTRSSWGHFDSVGIPLSADAVLEERFTPSAAGDRLDYVLEVTDTATFTAPVELTKTWIYRPGGHARRVRVPARRPALRLRVGNEPGLLDAVSAHRFVFLAGAAARAGGAEDRAARVADQHAADLRQELAAGRRGQRDEEVRIVFGAAGEGAARGAHADGGPCFARRDVETEHAGAVLALHGLRVPRIVEHDDRHGLDLHRARFLERLGDDLIGLSERQRRHRSLRRGCKPCSITAPRVLARRWRAVVPGRQARLEWRSASRPHGWTRAQR